MNKENSMNFIMKNEKGAVKKNLDEEELKNLLQKVS